MKEGITMMSMGLKKNLIVGIIINTVLLGAMIVNAEVLSFRRYFTDNMVLQRDMPVNVSGFADKGATVTLSFGEQKKTAKVADDGTWQVTLNAIPASAKSAELTVVSSKGSKTASIKNVVVGDVYLYAVQASKDITLGRDENGRKAAESIKVNPLFRVMSIKNIPSTKPLLDLSAKSTKGWFEVDNENSLKMSAAAFYFGKDLVSDLKVPVGIVDLDMGPNFSISWISREAIDGSDEFFGKKTPVEGYLKFMEETKDNFENRETLTDLRVKSRLPEVHPINDPRYPASGFNAVINPLRGITLKGILLQLGNDYPYLVYEKLVKEGKAFDRSKLDKAWWNNYMLRKHGFRSAPYIIPRIPYQWRVNFGNEKLPIAFIMPPSSDLVNYAMHHTQIRELQRKATEKNQKVGLIMPGNESIPFSGQPIDQKLLGKRCLKWALGSLYGRNQPASGPLMDKVETNYSKAQVFFKEGTAEGLKAKDGSLDQFEVAGIDAEFSPAKAWIDGKTIRLESDVVAQVSYVRYNWKESPDQGLVNSSGLPAVPFRSDDYEYVEFPKTTENNLPMEYSTHANKWASGDVAIVSGTGGGYGKAEGYLGATGLKVKPFGPNMRVRIVIPGSPSDGKIFPEDLIYSVNGKMLDDDPLQLVADAITLAESEKGAGKITFGLQRKGKNMDVELKLEVLGTYSVTAPYNCPKTNRIVSEMENFLAERGGQASGAASGGWLHTDQIFLLAAGTPEYQGLVRRKVYKMIDSFDPKTKEMPGGGTWGLAYSAMFLAEYYLATGDKNVFPHLKWYCDALAATQCKKDTFPDLKETEYGGWRHNYPGGRWYGMLPPIGLPGMVGYALADEAGVEINRECYDLAMNFFRKGQAEMGNNQYSASITYYDAPRPIDPEKMLSGKLNSHNGANATAAILFKLRGEKRIAHLNSLYCAFAYNNTEGGHGSNFFNGLWTPLGAYAHSKPAFINFMKNHHWFQDLRRMYNYSYKPSTSGAPGVGHAISMVVPRQKLRIVGAPPSIFAKNQKAVFQPSLKAYYNRDYAKAEKLANDLLKSGEIESQDKVKIQQIARAAKEIQKSIEIDLAKVSVLIEEGKLYEASLDLSQLTGVVPEGNEGLAAIETTLATTDPKVLREDKKRYDEFQKSIAFGFDQPKTDMSDEESWHALTSEAIVDSRRKGQKGRAEDKDATKWTVKIVESVSQAPKGWSDENFDAGSWGVTTLPISWHINHIFLGRTTFDIKDKSKVEGLRLSAYLFRQQDIVVYINGNVFAKINNCGNSGQRVLSKLTPAALKHLKNGKNTIAVTTRNDWRWASRNNVSGGGFGIRLDAKFAE